MITSVRYTVLINRLLGDDDYATIDNNYVNNPLDEDINDIGKYFNWISLDLTNDISNPQSASSTIGLITSNYYNNLATTNQGESTDKISNFLNSLVGRSVVVSVAYSEVNKGETTQSERILFSGFISGQPNDITPNGGAKFFIPCQLLLSQLARTSPNNSYQDSTETADGTFTLVSGNTISTTNLLNRTIKGTMIEEIQVVQNDAVPSFPDTLWAFLLPTVSKYDTLVELITVYSRLLYQHENGDILIAPLYIDDYTDDSFNIDVQDNTQTKNFMRVYDGFNNSINQPNRVDVQLGIVSPVPLMGLVDVDDPALKQVFCTAPYIKDGKIIDVDNGDDSLKYTDVYATSTRLYNSGYYVMPDMRKIALDNALTSPENAALANLLLSQYSANQLFYSVTEASTLPPSQSIVQIYAQVYLAEINERAYGVTVEYDFMTVINTPSPLAKIVSIANCSSLDFDENIVTRTNLRVNSERGSIFTIKTAPLLSILPAWYVLNKDGDSNNG